jgi:hypothetical protein
MKHTEIVRKLKSMRKAELDERRSNLEWWLRSGYGTEVERSDARYELNLIDCEVDEREVAESMRNLFRFNLGS